MVRPVVTANASCMATLLVPMLCNKCYKREYPRDTCRQNDAAPASLHGMSKASRSQIRTVETHSIASLSLKNPSKRSCLPNSILSSLNDAERACKLVTISLY